MQSNALKKIFSLFLLCFSLVAFSQDGQNVGLEKKQATMSARDSIRNGIQLEKEKNIAIYRRLLEQGLVTQEHFDEVVAMREKIASEKLANNTKTLEISTMPAEKPRSETDKYSGGPKSAQANAGIPANNPGQSCNCTTDFSGPQEKDIYWYHTDHLGSSSFVTGLDGEVNQNIEYFPSGEVFVENHRNSYNTPYKFNGKELDDETGYYYYGARYYNPRVSLWLNVDPLADYNPVQNLESYIDGNHNGGVYNSGNLNPYIYCYNSPIDYVDPNGKQSYFNSKVDAKGRRYLEFVSRNDEPSNPHWKGLTVVNVYDNTNRYVTDIVSATDAPGKVEAKYGSHYLKEKEHISGWEATKTVAKIAWESDETRDILLAPFLGIAIEFIGESSIVTKLPRIKDIKEFKSLIRAISKTDSELNFNTLKKFEKVTEKFGGKLRYDLEPVKGNWKPHVQVEGLGQKIESRHIQLTDEAVKILKNGSK